MLARGLRSAARRVALSAAQGLEYRRCRRELGALYQVVAATYRTLEAAAERGFVAPLPEFVRDGFEASRSTCCR